VAYLGLGSNLGDRESNLRRAREILGAAPGTTLAAESSLYVTAPVGGPEQDDFLNQVVAVRTTLSPRALLLVAQRIEQELSRRRLVRWGPRSIDVDILWYHDFSSTDADLQVPHPRMEERRFVLEPLAELAPDLVLPSGRTVSEALTNVQDQAVARFAAQANTTAPRTSRGGPMDERAMHREIRQLAQEKGAVILAHNYERPEIQDVADLVGDSLELSRKAAASDARMIVFCGVHFMAETAVILAPDRPVVLPELRAGCSMADMVDVDGLRVLKAQHPNAVVVSYVNTSAAVKALTDICCTSANAVQVVRSVPEDREIIFTPDRNLGAWAAKKAERELILWPGFCPTHELIQVSDVQRARAAHPGAKVVVHPECPPEVSDMADAVESTSGMIRYCRDNYARDYLIGTEAGMLYRLSKECPGKRFYGITKLSVCPFMKLITMEKLLEALRNEGPVVTVDPETRARALQAVQRMVEVGP
jgi:quinolinate synthase